MELLLICLFVFLGYLSVSLVLAQDQSGFISLDCGLVPGDESYTERTTNLTYVSDANFISFGESKSIKDDYKPRFQQQAWTLRSFPRGLRNCYELNLTKGGHYLIKATFVYGNYDDLNQGPEFDLYLGTNLWTTMTIGNATTAMLAEIMHVLTSDRLHVCLEKTGNSTPFISSLEIRPLRNGTYRTQSGSLMNAFKLYIGSADDPGFIRFPGDVLDRGWTTYFQNDWARITTTSPINDTSDTYKVPQSAMKTAARPRNSSQPLNISLPFPPGLLIYVYMHFAELERLQANESREFSITYNGVVWQDPFSPLHLATGTVLSPTALGAQDGKYEFIFEKTENSTHPPIINAFEVFYVNEMLQPQTHETDVDAINHIKSLYGVSRISWQGDPCAPQNYTWSGLNCSYNEFNPPRIISLNLSGSGLTGEITAYISNLTILTNLDLSNNNLDGAFPQFLAQMTSLSVLNLSGNQLSGSVPAALMQRANEGSLTVSIEGNSELCESNSCNNTNEKKKKKTAVVPIVASIASFCVVMAVLMIFFIRKKKNHTAKGMIIEKAFHNPLSLATNNRRVSYEDVIKITNNFEVVLGRGGFGEVYHGYMDGKKVAVKVLSESSAQGYKQFKAEVEILLRVHHKNLVSLLGYCEERDKMVLIYEFMANRDLQEHLSGKPGTTFLNWETRIRISAEAAQGLEYLHRGCKQQIIHRDVKTTNILLDEDFGARLSDFGLSRSFSTGSETHISTVLAGTPGFLDPEYCRSNHLTEKSDVYSFGVVLLEIFTNRPVIDQSRHKTHLSDWVNFMLNEGDIKRIIDPQLQENFDTNSAWKVIEVAMACVSQSSTRRPSMSYVVIELNECLASQATRKDVSPAVYAGYSTNVSSDGAGLGSELMPHAR